MGLIGDWTHTQNSEVEEKSECHFKHRMTEGWKIKNRKEHKRHNMAQSIRSKYIIEVLEKEEIRIGQKRK